MIIERKKKKKNTRAVSRMYMNETLRKERREKKEGDVYKTGDPWNRLA